VTWTLERASAYVAALAEDARRAGWVVGIYGSTLTSGKGRDLDLLCVPSRPHADRDAFERLLGVAEQTDSYPAAWDTSLGAAYRLEDGSIVDVLYVSRIDARELVW
jgi:hypothetical protein